MVVDCVGADRSTMSLTGEALFLTATGAGTGFGADETSSSSENLTDFLDAEFSEFRRQDFLGLL